MNYGKAILTQERDTGYKEGWAAAREASFDIGYEAGRVEGRLASKTCRGCWLLAGYFIGALTHWFIT